MRGTLTTHPAPPENAPVLDPDGAGPWEAVEEASNPISEPLFWSSPDPGFDLPTEPAFTRSKPGPHRRVSARGRLRAFDEAILEPVEDYLVEVWPEPQLRAAEILIADGAPF